MKKKRKLNIKNLIVLILLVISITFFLVSIFKIGRWLLDYHFTSKQVNELNNVNISEQEDNENTEIITQETDIPKENPYWDYIKMKLINVDFKELKQKNNDTVAWIQVNGTNINYPVVQTKDNEYYLTHSYNKTYNQAGWVFLDYRNNIDELNNNTIIYAHGRLDNTMFGSLKNSLTSGWLNNTDNYVVKMSTETENTLWQVFSVYKIPTTNDYIQVNFNTKESYKEFTELLLNRSQFNFNTNISENDKILTLSTCYNLEDKVVLHAKLIKKEKRITSN